MNAFILASKPGPFGDTRTSSNGPYLRSLTVPPGRTSACAMPRIFRMSASRGQTMSRIPGSRPSGVSAPTGMTLPLP